MVWRDILNVALKCPQLMEVFKANSKITIGDGRLISFWLDHWVGGDCLKKLFPRLFSVSMQQGLSVAVTKSRSNGGGEWDLSFRRALFQWEVEELRKMKELLQTAPELSAYLVYSGLSGLYANHGNIALHKYGLSGDLNCA
ncbi:hypothetical protein LOK49_LG02G01860 [Camellia lanceoleosa]|uniref:Uncharacterized protein n=1 Tax=Camellia lanceoleosa TaxID=1840588 RepID=A0ACC0IMP4_9ERIC|nr:hypothetical protein LOK49_LG02G01860 [Camellia lanceoleosa]